MVDIVGKRKYFYLISALILVPGIISLLIQPGLRLGVDFTGGTLWVISGFQQPPSTETIRNIIASSTNLQSEDIQIQSSTDTSGSNGVQVRTKEITEEQHNAILQKLHSQFGETLREDSYTAVGPIVGAEIARNALLAIAAASIGIMLYIIFAFRNVPNSFRYGTCTLIALVHDAIVVLGIFSILGHLFDIEVEALFVTAVLTVIGFSVHDTIVVFDRIRENWTRHGNETFEQVVNHSIVQTLVRSLNTSMTVIITLSALVLFGGASIRTFVLALLIGIITGTYSSIFNASCLLVSWQTGELGRFLTFWRRGERRTQPA